MGFSFNRKYFTDEQIINYINTDMKVITILSVINPESGHVYMSPVWTIFHGGKFYLSTDDNNFKSKFSQLSSVKVGLAFVEPESYPTGRIGIPPYVTISGSAKLLKKEMFSDYRKIIDLLYDKFDAAFPTKESKTRWIKFLMDESKTRVLMEITSEKVNIMESFEKQKEEHDKRKKEKELDSTA